MNTELRDLKRLVRTQRIVMYRQRVKILVNGWTLARRQRQVERMIRRLERENPERAAKMRTEYDELMSGVAEPHE